VRNRGEILRKNGRIRGEKRRNYFGKIEEVKGRSRISTREK
jgi:hypothetical protein